MVILEVGITNFGKLQDVRLSFQNGINIIYGDNEAGKSTVHAFIRAMLFGLDRQRGRASRTDDYTRYEPWENPAAYEGTLRFQKGGVVYRIYRRFGRLDRKTEILNEATGELLTEEQLHELLGRITESSFLNTVCIGQMRVVPGQSLSQELQNSLVNYLSAGEPEWDVNRAFAFLTEEKKKLLKNYEPRLEEELRAAEQDLQNVEEELMQQTICKEEAEEELEDMRQRIERERQEYENSARRKKMAYAELGISVLSLVLMLVSYVLNYPGECVWIFGTLALLSGFLAWKGHKLTTVSFALEEAEKKEKALAEQIQKVDWRLEQMRERAALYHNGLEAYAGQIAENRKLYEQIQALQLAEQTLKQVTASMQQRVSEQMQERMSQLLSAITAGRYEKIFVQDKAEIFLYEKERRIPIYQLSRGTIEQAYLALRLAASDCVMGYERLPLLFDETFVYYDEERLKNVLAVLADQPRQILLFTCHRREGELLEGLDGVESHRVTL